MDLGTVFTTISGGGVVAVIFVLLALVEFVPIKVSPLGWIGKRLNKDTLDQVKGIEKKLDDHISQSLRTKILNFQDDIISNKDKTREQWVEVVNAIYKYEKYCKENEISNGLCREASTFLLNTYQFKLQHNQL